MTEEDNILMDKYFRNSLSEDEKVIFDERLKNSDFSNSIKEMEKVILASKDIDETKMRGMLNEIETIKSRSIKKKWLFGGIILFLFALLCLILWTKQSAANPSKKEMLFAQYYTPFPNIIDPVSKGSSPEEISLSQLYEIKNYKEVIAISSMNDLLSDSDKFYQGLSYIEVNEIENARTSLQQIKSSKFELASKWYLALLCLRSNEDHCKTQFIEITKSEHPLAKKAKMVLDVLD